MCAAFELDSRIIRPGRWVGVWRSGQSAEFVWAGFARSEVMAWWQKRGGELVDIPAHRFAEKSDFDRKLRWDDIPPGQVIRGIIDPNQGKPLLKLVTRASSVEELSRFQHPRMPLIEVPIYRADPTPVRRNEQPAQGELFS